MNSMIQTFGTTYYNVVKYKDSYITIPCTNCTTYNANETSQYKKQLFSTWLKVFKENCKRFTKVNLRKKVKQQTIFEQEPQTISERELKKERRRTYLDNDRLAYFKKINNPNYNPFSPLNDAEDKAKPRSATMADDIARTRFLKAMNGDYDTPLHLTIIRSFTPIPILQQQWIILLT
jgi:hypothetical protein